MERKIVCMENGKSAGIKMTWFGNILYGLCDSKNMITRKLVKLYVIC